MTGTSMPQKNSLFSPPTDIIFITSYTETARDLILVANELRSRGFSVLFCLLNKNPALVRLIDDQEFDLIHYSDPQALLKVASADDELVASVPKSYEPSNAGSMLQILRRIAKWLGVEELGIELTWQRRAMRAAKRLFEIRRPRVVVMDADSVPPAIQISRAAQHLSVPSVVVQSGILATPHWLAVRNLTLQDTDSSCTPILERLGARVVQRFWPAFVQRVEGKPVLNGFGPFPVLVGAVLGVLPISNWLQFGGGGSAYAVAGEYSHTILTEYGIDPTKIHLCGHPRMDRAAGFGQSRLSGSLGRGRTDEPDGQIIDVLFATSPWARPGVSDAEEKRMVVGAVAREIAKVSERIRVTIKLHPREPACEYDGALRAVPRCRVKQTEDIVDLISQCDIFVTQMSTAALYSIAAGRPVVTFSFDGRAMFDLLHDMGVSIHCRNLEDIRSAVERLSSGSSASEAVKEQRAVLERKMLIDGQATRKVADLVKEYLRT